MSGFVTIRLHGYTFVRGQTDAPDLAVLYIPSLLMPATEDQARDLEIFEKLLAMDDESFVIRWKRRPKPVEAFLLRHKETAPRVIVQYATEKMDRAGKERFRRTQSAKAGAVRSRRTT